MDIVVERLERVVEKLETESRVSTDSGRNYTVYVRHHEKQWDNKYQGLYRLDAPLTEKGLCDWKAQIYELEMKYGIPDRIVCSPFYRCRQMLQELVKVYPNVPTEIDNQCGEYLGHQRLKSVDNTLLRDDTMIHPILYREDIRKLKVRAMKLYKKYTKISGYTLVITHGFLMYEIANYEDGVEGVSRKRSFAEGETLVIPMV